jgi:organic hydroperoxide reductase OsmC/OhrA
MSDHHAAIRWSRGDAPFEYQHYPRDHTWEFDGGQRVAASAAPGYLGSEQAVDPEEALVAALSSCHMLTLLAIAAVAYASRRGDLRLPERLRRRPAHPTEQPLENSRR